MVVANPLRHSNREWEGRKTLRLAFQAREGLWWMGRWVVVGTNPLRHWNREWEAGGAWQETPPTRVTSKEEGGHVQGVCECSGGKERTQRGGDNPLAVSKPLFTQLE